MLQSLKDLIGQRNPLRLLWHKAKALAAALRYGFPARHLTIIGITGTDGKTTTVGMVAHILQQSGIRTGALSTAFLRIGDEPLSNSAQKTTPSPFMVQRFLRQLVNAGCTHAVIEYSSHGLVQGRTLFTWPRVSAITNTAMEHLDYHGSMEQYRRDKGLLFSMLGKKGTKVLNAQDETFALYRSVPSEKTVVYSAANLPSPKGNSLPPHPALSLREREKRETSLHVREKNVWLSEITVTASGTNATVHLHDSQFKTQSSKLTLNIPGIFNLENALCAIGCCLTAGIPLEDCCSALATFRGIPGRMERIDEGQPFAVYVDFTVTPQAFEKTLTTLRQMTTPGKRILVLTGSCGDRMHEKRPIIGRLCSELADVVVITDDESYKEDPHAVMEEVWAGIDQSTTKAHKIFDRHEAIRFILAQAQPGDTVLLCGMGSYPVRMTLKGLIPWNEQEITRSILRESSS